MRNVNFSVFEDAERAKQLQDTYIILPAAAIELLETVYPHSTDFITVDSLIKEPHYGRVIRQRDTKGDDYFFAISKKSLAYQRINQDIIFETYKLREKSLEKAVLPKGKHLRIDKQMLESLSRNNIDRTNKIHAKVSPHLNIQPNFCNIIISDLFPEKCDYWINLPIRILEAARRVHNAVRKTNEDPVIHITMSPEKSTYALIGKTMGTWGTVMDAQMTNYTGELALSVRHLLRLAQCQHRKMRLLDRDLPKLESLTLQFNEDGPLVTSSIAGYQQLILRD